MDFAKKQLEKYGWSEGKGLGKNENGIAVALKPSLKFDNSGVGHKLGEQFTNNWWENVYNSALNNLEVQSEEGHIMMNLKTGDSVEITTKNYSVKQLKKNKNLEYGSFVKTSKLTETGVINYEKDFPEAAVPPKIPMLTDEELLAACGGRTAHKGARHGLKLSGKLSRIEKQEKLLLKKLQNVSLSDDRQNLEKKIKKISKHKERPTAPYEDGFLDDHDSRSSTSSCTPRKKRKKERKCVSFNDTVTEYHTQEHSENDPIPNVIVIERAKIRDQIEEKIEVQDEGIEQDCEGNSMDDNGHRSFEEAQTNRQQSPHKKKKKLKKKNTATHRFLEEINIGEPPEGLVAADADGCKKCNKRKHNMDVEDDGGYRKRYCNADHKTECKRRKKKRKKEEKRINSIAKSLGQVCKISDTE